MSWPGFYALSNAWYLLLLIPVVIFYFLKLKRPAREIPSLVLWQQVLQDNRVNSPFQRFKKHLLLLLQLLLLLALIAAAMQPYFRGKSQELRNLPILIDVSASMTAIGEDGRTPLEHAREQAADLINGLPPGQQCCLITFNQTARKLTSFTDNRTVLLDALEKIEGVDIESDLENALRLTGAISRNTSIENVILFSDGNIPEHVDFNLPFYLDFRRVGSPGANLGITAIHAERLNQDEWAVFVRIEGTPENPNQAVVELFQNDIAVGSEIVILDDASEHRLMFAVSGTEISRIKAELIVKGDDALDSDNTAFLELPLVRPLDVYAAPGLISVQRALGAIDGIRQHTVDEDEELSGRFDLIITDRIEDMLAEAGTRLLIGIIPEKLTDAIVLTEESDDVVDWNRREPILQHALFNDLVVLDKPVLQPGYNEARLEESGFRTLIHGSQGPLMLAASQSGTIDYYLLFHIDRSTLPYRISFPIMINNAVTAARSLAGLSEVAGVRTGVLDEIAIIPGKAAEVHSPENTVYTFNAGTNAFLTGIPARTTGFYTIMQDGKQTAGIGVSLLSPRETSLKQIDELAFDEGLSVAADEETVKVDRPLWPYLAGIGLLLLLAEWWLFHRRPVVIQV